MSAAAGRAADAAISWITPPGYVRDTLAARRGEGRGRVGPHCCGSLRRACLCVSSSTSDSASTAGPGTSPRSWPNTVGRGCTKLSSTSRECIPGMADEILAACREATN